MTPEGPYYEGAVAVVFEDTAAALACAKAMHGRFFDGRQIEVELQGKVEKDQLPERVLPVSHPAAGLVSRDYVEEGEEFVDLEARAKEKAAREEAEARRKREEEEKEKAAAAATAAATAEAEKAAATAAEEAEAFFKTLEG